MKKFAILMYLLFICFPAPAHSWQYVGETTIDGTTGTIDQDTIFQTVEGHIFQVDEYVYVYHYAYRPRVTILSEGTRYQLLIDGVSEELICKYLGKILVKSRIEDEFEGYEMGNVYVLTNGQIWRQTGYEYNYNYSYNPEVIIYQDGSSYYMKTENMDEAVGVERLK